MKERLLEGLHEIGVTVHENGSLSEPVYFYVSNRRVGLGVSIVPLTTSFVVTFIDGKERRVSYENLTKVLIEREFKF